MLYLKGRPHAIARAAWAAKTEAQIKAHRIVRYELEVAILEPDVSDEEKVLKLMCEPLHYGLGVSFINWTHDMAVAENASDIKTRASQFRKWINDNEAIREALEGYEDAKIMANDVATAAKAGDLADRTEDELQGLIGAIRASVPEPPEGARCYHC